MDHIEANRDLRINQRNRSQKRKRHLEDVYGFHEDVSGPEMITSSGDEAMVNSSDT